MAGVVTPPWPDKSGRAEGIVTRREGVLADVAEFRTELDLHVTSR